ncbi:MAG: sugar nucleotide-binding protein [Candidatus Kaelpia imicola]|nr:sugar nucleotide-binding protein [Candidatus Kaelpia imicola]
MKNSKDVLILGKGFIGEMLERALQCSITDKYISSFRDAQKIIEEFKPKVLINCIGSTGENNVDDCEKNPDKTLMANTFVPIILSEAALRYNIKLIHISSGCIYHFNYSEDEPIAEDKIPDFFELFYSRTKIYSEQILKILAKKYSILIVKIRIPLTGFPHPKNLLTKLIEYKSIIDIPNSITYIPDFINALEHLINIGAEGIYNAVNKGGLKYSELLDVYRKYTPDFNYKIIDIKELGLVRTNLILSTDKLEKTGFKIRDIHDVLEECVKNYIKY